MVSLDPVSPYPKDFQTLRARERTYCLHTWLVNFVVGESMEAASLSCHFRPRAPTPFPKVARLTSLSSLPPSNVPSVRAYLLHYIARARVPTCTYHDTINHLTGCQILVYLSSITR